MTRSISERDWKVFRELRLVALQRLCEKILDEAKTEIDRPGKSAHKKYLSLYKLVEHRDHDVARGFNDLRRSTALEQLHIIHTMGLFTEEDLQRFSPETMRLIKLFAGLR